MFEARRIGAAGRAPSQRGPAPRWLRRRAAALLLLVLTSLLAPACRKESPDIPPAPTPVAVEGLDPIRGPRPPDSPGPVATWTLPAVAPPPGSVPPAQALSTQTLPEGIPAPSAAPPSPVPPSGPPPTDPEILALMQRVEAARLRSDVQRLVGFGTRHAFSEADDPARGVGAARDWLHAEMARAMPAGRSMQIEFEAFPLAGGTGPQRNVIATLPGIGRTKRLVYLTAHYDSRAENAADGRAEAPGADDNASGVASLLELVRVMAPRQWDGTLRFAAFAAEEQAQAGSRHHAGAAARLGLPILAVLNLDIVGGASGPDGAEDPSTLRLFSEGPDEGASRRLARWVRWMAARYGSPAALVQPQADREGRASDHLAFSAAGFPALRLISGLEDMGRQHNARDTVDRLDADYHAALTRLGLALAANLALAPPAPAAAPRLARAPERPGALQVSWEPVPDPAVAGYWVALRDAGAQDYRRLTWSGGRDSREIVLEGEAGEAVAVSIASADDRGHTSLFSPEARP